MKKLLIITWILTVALNAHGYFEISNDIPTVFRADGLEQWRMWSGGDSGEELFDNSVGILFDEAAGAIVIGNFTPGATWGAVTSTGFGAAQGHDGGDVSAFGSNANQYN